MNKTINNKKMTKKELIKELKDGFNQYCQSVQKWMRKCEDNGMTYYIDKKLNVKAYNGDIINDLLCGENVNNLLIKTR